MVDQPIRLSGSAYFVTLQASSKHHHQSNYSYFRVNSGCHFLLLSVAQDRYQVSNQVLSVVINEILKHQVASTCCRGFLPGSYCKKNIVSSIQKQRKSVWILLEELLCAEVTCISAVFCISCSLVLSSFHSHRFSLPSSYMQCQQCEWAVESNVSWVQDRSHALYWDDISLSHPPNSICWHMWRCTPV